MRPKSLAAAKTTIVEPFVGALTVQTSTRLTVVEVDDDPEHLAVGRAREDEARIGGDDDEVRRPVPVRVDEHVDLVVRGVSPATVGVHGEPEQPVRIGQAAEGAGSDCTPTARMSTSRSPSFGSTKPSVHVGVAAVQPGVREPDRATAVAGGDLKPPAGPAETADRLRGTTRYGTRSG